MLNPPAPLILHSLRGADDRLQEERRIGGMLVLLLVLDEYRDRDPYLHTTHSQMLGKVESGGGPIFKVVLEC